MKPIDAQDHYELAMIANVVADAGSSVVVSLPDTPFVRGLYLPSRWGAIEVSADSLWKFLKLDNANSTLFGGLRVDLSHGRLAVSIDARFGRSQTFFSPVCHDRSCSVE